MTVISALDPLVRQQQELQQQFTPTDVFMAQPTAPIGFDPVQPPQRQERVDPPPPPAQQGGGMGGGFNPQMLEMFGVDMGGSGGSMFGGGGGAATGGVEAGGSAAGGGSSWMASAGPWAALAAAIMWNEEDSRKKGYRDEDRGKRMQDQVFGNVLWQDMEKKWGPKIFGNNDKFGFGADVNATGNIMTLDFSNAWDDIKEGTVGKLLGGLF